jgi:hypothetical protein
VVVILLFVGVVLSPVITAVDNYTEVDESIDNSRIEPLDKNEKEIFSKIDGSCLDSSFHGIGVFFNVEIWAGYATWIRIAGYTSLLPPRSYIVHSGTFVKAPIFIGYTFNVAPGAQTVHGIALGDIEWR